MRYKLVRMPTWYTGKPSNVADGYATVHEHKVVYCEAHGLTEIPSGYVVHHINGDPRDNRIENLQLMTRAEHAKHHRPVQNRSADWCTPDVKTLCGNSMKGKRHSEETRRKMSESQRKRMSSPEARLKASINAKAHWAKLKGV